MPTYKVVAIKGGPIDGTSTVIPVDCAVAWYVNGQLLPNSATVTATEMLRATGFYGLYRVKVGPKYHDVLHWHEKGAPVPEADQAVRA